MQEKVYTKEDLISFGLYLLSDERKQRFESHPEFSSDTVEMRLSRLHDADLDVWENLKS